MVSRPVNPGGTGRHGVSNPCAEFLQDGECGCMTKHDYPSAEDDVDAPCKSCGAGWRKGHECDWGPDDWGFDADGNVVDLEM